VQDKCSTTEKQQTFSMRSLGKDVSFLCWRGVTAESFTALWGKGAGVCMSVAREPWAPWQRLELHLQSE